MKACPCDDVAAAGSHHERRHLGSATSCAPTPDQAAATSGSSAPPRPATPVTGQATWPPSRRSWTTSSAARWTGTTSGSLQDDWAPGNVAGQTRPGRSRCWPLIIRTIRQHPSGSVWIDGPSNVSRPDRSGADQIDAQHQPTDLVATPQAGVGQLWRLPDEVPDLSGMVSGISPPAPSEPNLRAGAPWPAVILWSQGTAPGRRRFRGRGQVFRPG